MEIANILNEVAVREQHLKTYGYNVVNIHASLVEYDLMTDSWTELLSQEMTDRMSSLHAAVDFSDTDVHAASIFPFKHFASVSQGRAAEAFFWRTAGRKNGKVIQNLLFPTSRHHVVINRMTPLEMPVEHVLDMGSDDLFRGNLDCNRLRDLLRDEGSGSIAWIYIEAENNASGGYPVSMGNVREIHAIASEYGIPMVVDCTRIVENSILIQRFETGFSEIPLSDIVREFCGHFDAMTCSLAKDFGITRGGVIGVNDERTFHRITDTVSTFGSGVNATDKAIINAAFKNWSFIERAAIRRVDQAARMHAALTSKGLPVAQPASGHCLLFEVGNYLDLEKYQHAVTAFTAWIYAQTGVRSGWHVTGMTPEFARSTLVRFAIPLCTPDARIEALTGPLVSALREMGDIPDMQLTSAAPGITGRMRAIYSPILAAGHK